MDWGTVIVAVISAIGLDRLVVYLFEARARRRKAEAEANAAEADADNKKIDGANRTLEGAFRLIDVLEKQLDSQECEIAQVKSRVSRVEQLHRSALQRIEYLMAGIKRLIGQIRDLGHEPVWTPDEWDPEEEGDG